MQRKKVPQRSSVASAIGSIIILTSPELKQKFLNKVLGAGWLC
jgi:hypothetical protein